MKKIEEVKAKVALNQLERNSGQPIRKVFQRTMYLDRITDAKLLLLSIATKRSKNSIIDEILNKHIRDFEKLNGKLENIIKEEFNEKGT